MMDSAGLSERSSASSIHLDKAGPRGLPSDVTAHLASSLADTPFLKAPSRTIKAVPASEIDVTVAASDVAVHA